MKDSTAEYNDIAGALTLEMIAEFDAIEIQAQYDRDQDVKAMDIYDTKISHGLFIIQLAVIYLT